ncbi:MAG: sulfurtransferase/chromate resistance protein, partial [Gammaproteobacteria bacterium]|nr:sulfurtransferase/chromate resistance protein [Gammaproteobacteria bacterium]
MPSPNEITVAQLSRLIGTPAAPVVIDVRIDDDFAEDPDLIPTALRHPHHDIAALAPQLAGRQVVVYCQKGKKISQGAMALLRNHRVKAEALEGGHFAWRDAGEALLPAAKIPRQQATGRSVWVTRHRPKIDRMACPWLIRRFVDARAQFLFVAPAEVAGVAEKFDATPFDIEGVFWSHRGDSCTFDTMLEEFRLETDALLKLATIVRGADTDRPELAPQSAGLLAASLGLSRMYRDDLEQVDAGMLLYDAFYRWAR